MPKKGETFTFYFGDSEVKRFDCLTTAAVHLTIEDDYPSEIEVTVPGARLRDEPITVRNPVPHQGHSLAVLVDSLCTARCQAKNGHHHH